MNVNYIDIVIKHVKNSKLIFFTKAANLTMQENIICLAYVDCKYITTFPCHKSWIVFCEIDVQERVEYIELKTPSSQK